jgi:DNA-binding GntR family transcriptional regulator
MSAMAKPHLPRPTMASVVADQLRRRIMTGQLLPDAQLRVSELALNYKTAISPVREALNRLSSEGLVDVRDMRGFFVAPASVDELREITQARCLLNDLALRRSIAKGDEHWEETVLLAYHRLGRVPRRTESGHPSSDWDDAHRAFHRTLTAGCGSRFLIDFCDQLFVKADRYRHLARLSPAASVRRRDAEHTKLLQAVVGRRSDEAVALLTSHFEATADLSRAALNNSGSRILSRRGAVKA